MSLWDGMKKMGAAAYGAAKEKAEKIQEYKRTYEQYDDDELLRRYRNSSGDRRNAILMVLKERGFTASDLQ